MGVLYPHKTANARYDTQHFYTMEPSFFNRLQEFKWHMSAKWEKEVEVAARIEGRKGSAASSLQPPQ